MVSRNLQSLCSSQLSDQSPACLHTGNQSQATEAGNNFTLQIAPNVQRNSYRVGEGTRKKGCINSTLPVQQNSSPGRGMLPNFSASSGSSRTASASRTGGVWVSGEGGGMQEGFIRECTFFPVTQRIQNRPDHLACTAKYRPSLPRCFQTIPQNLNLTF